MKRLSFLLAGLVLWLALPAFATDTVTYYYTNTLHSAVVETNAQGTAIEQTHYAPYGQVLNRALRDGPGYTGHEEDPGTGLSYMQQRYYDPQSGRFLSVDPMTADGDPGGNFNRYWYAKDNPYRYTDPDGRQEAPDDAEEDRQLQEELNPKLSQGTPAENAQAQSREDANEKVLGKLESDNAKLISGDAGRNAQKKISKFIEKYTKGGEFSRKTKRVVAERDNRHCVYCRKPTTPAQKSMKGVTPPTDEAQTDHIVPRSHGGTNSPDNAAHACRACNQSMSDKPKPPPPRMTQDGGDL